MNKILSAISDQTWDNYFGFQLSNNSKSLPSFAYLSRLTALRPRDYIKLLRITHDRCVAENQDNPSTYLLTSDEFRKAYSDYYFESITTALRFYYDDEALKVLKTFLKTIRQNEFTYELFNKRYVNFPQKNMLTKHFKSADDLLCLLFDFNAICGIEPNGFHRWKFKETYVSTSDYSLPPEFLTKKGKFKFHQGLEKILCSYVN